MSDQSLPKTGLLRAGYLCFLAIFAPKRLVEQEGAQNEFRDGSGDRAQSERRVRLVNRAFWRSLLLVLLSAAIGFILGRVVGMFVESVLPQIVVGFQTVGTMVLLWGTLFIRGWEIQTLAGGTLAERVNRWIYQTLYCAGTATLVFSVALPSSAK
jgi:hypothetical protein